MATIDMLPSTMAFHLPTPMDGIGIYIFGGYGSTESWDVYEGDKVLARVKSGESYTFFVSRRKMLGRLWDFVLRRRRSSSVWAWRKGQE